MKKEFDLVFDEHDMQVKGTVTLIYPDKHEREVKNFQFQKDLLKTKQIVDRFGFCGSVGDGGEIYIWKVEEDSPYCAAFIQYDEEISSFYAGDMDCLDNWLERFWGRQWLAVQRISTDYTMPKI